ncbi:sensor histidine kinase [Saccharibacillus kuerlensis]|uniref:histidine kinase n=1 Tax=Saccharibacillus kuerlensis TaxID=459527 RepID=A0ABQ2KT49_9BACL|nr:HAMP domain-containing sensor histidine kinase [Saccharibacillus kuerlensis]GGN90851.1 two-component sensor histidine kinase [Saccharibacillus kuerlensis]
MKKQAKIKRVRIARRLGLHFTIQFLMTWLSVILTIFVCLFAILHYLGNEQLRSSSPAGILESLSTEAIVNDNSVEIPSFWPEQLVELEYWLQIVNDQGEVIYASNVPEEIPGRYTSSQLLLINDTGRLNKHRLATFYEDLAGIRIFYLLGREDVNGEMLREWFNEYAEGGQIPVSVQTLLGNQASNLGASLRVLDNKGRTIQSIGSDTNLEAYGALDLIKLRNAPGKSDTELAYYYDPFSEYTWLLEWPKPNTQTANQPMFRTLIIVSSIVGGSILLLTFGVSAWHGYRYGGPLLLFMRGFERMGRGEYEQVFTEKERRKIFRKNGRFRARYKLYREVIAGFSDMADELARARNERLRLEQSREEWMAGISHDLRTPLAAVQGYGHLLESGQFQWSNEELRNMGGVIREKSGYMLELLQDFSLTFELKNHTPGENLEPLELNEFVRRTVLRYVNDASLHNAVFDFEENQTPVIILANSKWFQRLLDNLISNAVKHNDSGTEIVLCVRKCGNEAVIEVRDNGSGMDEETKSRLFDRYYRGTNTDEGVDGAGLGMSIAYAVVTAHKGTITVDSKPGKGTLIILTFPLAPLLPETISADQHRLEKSNRTT